MKEFQANIGKLYTQYSFYVVFFISGVIAYWLQMAVEEQAAVLAAFPSLKLVAPFSGFVAFMIARGVPQAPKAD